MATTEVIVKLCPDDRDTKSEVGIRISDELISVRLSDCDKSIHWLFRNNLASLQKVTRAIAALGIVEDHIKKHVNKS